MTSNFVSTVGSKYRIHSYHTQLVKMVEDAEEELYDGDEELKKLRAEYSKLVADENATEEQLLALEKKMEEAEEERDHAAKNYEKARHTTIQDLKEEHAYETWKENR